MSGARCGHCQRTHGFIPSDTKRLGRGRSFSETWQRGCLSWQLFAYTAPNRLDAAEDQQYTGYHGTHLECLHAILSTGRLLPSDRGSRVPEPLRIGAVSTCTGRV